jgi:hypothetical protein
MAAPRMDGVLKASTTFKMMKVEDDQNSEDGKKFEKNFQQLMKECN